MARATTPIGRTVALVRVDYGARPSKSVWGQHWTLETCARIMHARQAQPFRGDLQAWVIAGWVGFPNTRPPTTNPTQGGRDERNFSHFWKPPPLPTRQWATLSEGRSQD
mmetsp:Transcript_38498/g.68921  ORF Transcript_38498/g.68921 Transcript_38498/m.68921 type:complete len:109 (+) Transcript_38498:896-1222(+)